MSEKADILIKKFQDTLKSLELVVNELSLLDAIELYNLSSTVEGCLHKTIGNTLLDINSTFNDIYVKALVTREVAKNCGDIWIIKKENDKCISNVFNSLAGYQYIKFSELEAKQEFYRLEDKEYTPCMSDKKIKDKYQCFHFKNGILTKLDADQWRKEKQ